MGFPYKVAEEVLVNCARHCSICHKFCGLKIELHHIKQKADGGKDTFENCIPLCFDCHAEVKAYNPKHPKGRMYTESELIRHRDNWYSKVKNSGGNVENSTFLKQDKEVFEKIKMIFDNNEILFFVNKYDFGGAFDLEILKPLKNFYYNYDYPEFEFFDMDLESMREKLKDAVDKFLNCVSYNTRTNETGRKDRILLSVPGDWEVDDPINYKKAVKELNDSADYLWLVYCEFIKLCRMKLIC